MLKFLLLLLLFSSTVLGFDRSKCKEVGINTRLSERYDFDGSEYSCFVFSEPVRLQQNPVDEYWLDIDITKYPWSYSIVKPSISLELETWNQTFDLNSNNKPINFPNTSNVTADAILKGQLNFGTLNVTNYELPAYFVLRLQATRNVSKEEDAVPIPMPVYLDKDGNEVDSKLLNKDGMIYVKEIKITLNDYFNHSVELISTDMIRFGADEYRIVLESPDNTTINLDVIRYGYDYENVYYVTDQGELINKVEMQVFDGYRLHDSSNLIKNGSEEILDIKLSEPRFIRTVSSTSNVLTLAFDTRGAVKFNPKARILSLVAIVIPNPDSCLIYRNNSESINCNWIKDDNNTSFLISSEATIYGPTCMTVTFTTDWRTGMQEVFLVVWEIGNSSHVLYRHIGTDTIKVRSFDIIPSPSRGKIRMLSTTNFVSVEYVTTKNEFCYDVSKYKNINCRFNSTLCEWEARPSGLERFELTDNGLLMYGSAAQIISPEITVPGSHCFHIITSSVYGYGRLNVMLLDGAEIFHLQSYLIQNVESREHSRLLLKDVNKGTRIILVTKGWSENKINILETLLLPVDQCCYKPPIKEGDLKWIPEDLNLENFNQLECESLPKQTQTFHTPLFSNREGFEWICFRYHLRTSPYFPNFCFEITLVQYFSNVNSSLHGPSWSDCSPGSEISFGCLPLHSDANEYQLKYLTKLEAEHTSPLHIDYVVDGLRISTSSDAVTVASLSWPFLSKSYDCEVSKLNCGWHQTSLTSVNWSRGENRLTFSRKYGKEGIGFVHSPPFKVGNGSFATISFKVRCSSATNVTLRLKKWISSELVLISQHQLLVIPQKPEFSEIINTVDSGAYYQVEIGVSRVEGYIEDFKVSSFNEGNLMDCDFDSDDHCGWFQRVIFVKESHYETSKNRMTPLHDSKFNKNGGYLTLLNVTYYSHIFSTNVSSLPFRPSSDGGQQCLKFAYYMNWDDMWSDEKINNITLILKLEFDSGNSTQLWKQKGSHNFGWYRVQIPLTERERFRVIFYVQITDMSILRSDKFVAIDSVSIVENVSNCKRMQVSIDPEIALIQ